MRFFIQELTLNLPHEYVIRMKTVVKRINEGYWLNVGKHDLHMMLVKLESDEVLFLAMEEGSDSTIEMIHSAYRVFVFELCRPISGGTVEMLQKKASFREISFREFYNVFDTNWNACMCEDKVTMLNAISVDYPCDRNYLILLDKMDTIINEIACISKKIKAGSMVKIAKFCNLEVYMDSDFIGRPSLELYYLDDGVKGTIDIESGSIEGNFSKYVRTVIEAWLNDNRVQLLHMWNSRKMRWLPEWE